MRKYGRLDSNQEMIVKRLNCIPGVTVLSIASMGNGAPDLLIGYAGKNYLIELKSTDKAPLTKHEAIFFNRWKGQICICRSFDDVLQLLGID